MGLNPQKNSDVTGTSTSFIGVISPAGYVNEWDTHFIPWLNARSVSSGAIENMFQHYDSLNVSHRVWHQDPYWLMNASNPTWVNYLSSMMIEWMSGMDDDGVFFDVAVETYGWAYHPKQDTEGYYWWKSPHFPYGWSPLPDLSDFATWQNAQYTTLYTSNHSSFHNSTFDRLVIVELPLVAFSLERKTNKNKKQKQKQKTKNKNSQTQIRQSRDGMIQLGSILKLSMV